jgi:hypothetical protein
MEYLMRLPHPGSTQRAAGSQRPGPVRRWVWLIALAGIVCVGCQATGRSSIETVAASRGTSSPPGTPTATATSSPSATATGAPTPTPSLTPTEPPPTGNDDPPGISITSLPFTHTTDTSQAQTHHLERGPRCATLASYSRSVWYAFTPDVPMTVVADTVGSDYDTIVDVFAGALSSDILDPYYFEEFDQLDPIACNDNDGNTLQSRVVFAATAGQAYVVRVTASDATGGSLVFSLSGS